MIIGYGKPGAGSILVPIPLLEATRGNFENLKWMVKRWRSEKWEFKVSPVHEHMACEVYILHGNEILMSPHQHIPTFYLPPC